MGKAKCSLEGQGYASGSYSQSHPHFDSYKRKSKSFLGAKVSGDATASFPGTTPKAAAEYGTHKAPAAIGGVSPRFNGVPGDSKHVPGDSKGGSKGSVNGVSGSSKSINGVPGGSNRFPEVTKALDKEQDAQGTARGLGRTPATSPAGALGAPVSTDRIRAVRGTLVGAPIGAVGVVRSPGTKVEEVQITHAYTVLLRRRSDLGYFCAGVLISRRHVLTAAHCVDSSRSGSDSNPVVVVGSGFLSQTEGPGAQVIATKATFLHPSYPPHRFPNLAILKLKAAAKQTPIQLPTRFLPKWGDTLEAIGWGRQSSTSGNADAMQVVSLEFLPKRSCRQEGGGIVRAHQICMGGQGASTCNGDDGGPIVLRGMSRRRDILVGIIGDEHSCGAPGKPDIHTNIAPYLGWIESIAGIR